MKCKFTALLAAVLSLLLVLSGCGESPAGTSTPPANETGEPTLGEGAGYGNLQYLRMCSGTQGATWTIVGSAMMEFVNQSMDISASCGPGGAVANVNAVANGENEMGWSFISTVASAINGTGAFEGQDPASNLYHVMSIFPSQQHFVVAANSDIQSMADLNGRIVNYTPTTETSYTANVAVLNAYGITPDTIQGSGGTVTMTRFNEASELMKNGELDLWTACIASPAATVSELAFTPGIRFLNIDEDKIPTILESLPGFMQMTIPAGTYDGVDNDVLTIGTVGCIITNDSIPDDVIYDFLKVQYEHWEDLKAINPNAFGDLSVENWLDGADYIPLHPGAERFYKEIGVLS